VAEKHIKKVGRFRAESTADHLESLSALRKDERINAKKTFSYPRSLAGLGEARRCAHGRKNCEYCDYQPQMIVW